jgi:small conductance mechanosensitive channel
LDSIIDNVIGFFSKATADAALRILGAVIMVAVGLFIIKHLMRLFDRYTGNKKIDQGVMSFLSSLLKITLRVILFIMAATYLGVPNTSFIAILSSIGLAVGLGLQGSLGNFAGGLMLLIFHPFHVGDYIQAGDVAGTVLGINILYTQMKTPDNKLVIVPNSTLSNGVVTNFSAMETRRVDISFTVGADSDIEAVKRLMAHAASEHPLVLEDPEPAARMGGMTGGLMNFTLRCWAKTPDFWAVTFDLNERLKNDFDREHIHLPPPQSKVQIVDGRQP